MPVWLSVCLAALAVVIVTGVVAYLIDRINHV
jgi:hypothetical protein